MFAIPQHFHVRRIDARQDAQRGWQLLNPAASDSARRRKTR
jgi:hypothetical protein